MPGGDVVHGDAEAAVGRRLCGAGESEGGARRGAVGGADEPGDGDVVDSVRVGGGRAAAASVWSGGMLPARWPKILEAHMRMRLNLSWSELTTCSESSRRMTWLTGRSWAMTAAAGRASVQPRTIVASVVVPRLA